MIKLKRKGLKIILLIILFFAIISVVALIIVNNNLNSIVTTKIQEDFNQTEYSKYYNLSFKNLHINILTGTIKFTDVELTPKEDVDTMYFFNNGKYNITIKNYVLKGADIYKYIETDTVKVRLIKIEDPKIEIINYTKKLDEEIAKEFILSPFVDVKKIIVKNAKFKNTDYFSSSTKNINDINITINNFHYKSKKSSRHFEFSDAIIKTGSILITTKDNNAIIIDAIENRITNFMFTDYIDTSNYSFDNFLFQLTSLNTSTNNKDYNISVANIVANFKDKDIKIYGIKLTALFSKQEFAQKYKHPKEQFDIDISSIHIVELELDSLIQNQTILAKGININDGNINIYIDKTKPIDLNKFPLLLNQSILKIPYRTNIEKIKIRNIKLLYKEKLEPSRTGFVDITLDADLKNINNIETDKPFLITVNGKVHNVIPFNLNLEFDYNTIGFSYNGKVKSFKIEKLNTVIESFYPIKIKSGMVKSISFKGSANNNFSIGTMEFKYNKLKLKILSEYNQSDLENYKNDILSLTANTIILSNNPSNKSAPIRNVKFVFERNKNKGIANYIWKSFFTGISETVMPGKENRKKYSKIRKEKRNKAKNRN